MKIKCFKRKKTGPTELSQTISLDFCRLDWCKSQLMRKITRFAVGSAKKKYRQSFYVKILLRKLALFFFLVQERRTNRNRKHTYNNGGHLNFECQIDIKLGCVHANQLNRFLTAALYVQTSSC